jgi:hypothetical protein
MRSLASWRASSSGYLRERLRISAAGRNEVSDWVHLASAGGPRRADKEKGPPLGEVDIAWYGKIE